MENDAIGFSPSPGSVENRTRTSRLGHSWVRLWTGWLIRLILAGVIVLPWLPIWEPLGHNPAMQWARGSTRFPIVALAFAPDGLTIATTHEDGRVVLWEVANRWSIKRTLDDRWHERAVAFSPDGRSLVMGGS